VGLEPTTSWTSVRIRSIRLDGKSECGAIASACETHGLPLPLGYRGVGTGGPRGPGCDLGARPPVR